ncbi:MAG: radical SAM family heme chaperone HemW [Oscillospiraceae bacterium]
MMKKTAGLYIHVPFCARKCAYCDFYSAPPTNTEIFGKYVQAVRRNILNQSLSYDTVYFGGGTPSLLSPKAVEEILDSADILPSAEITAECNPDSANLDKLKGFKAAGLNRISVGVQSFDDNELQLLGRLHDSRTAVSTLENAFKAGFENISADLMLGLPYQKWETIERNIQLLSELPVTHISAYMLKIEEGTPLSKNKQLAEASADDDMSAELYERAVMLLAEKGFQQYEISNFAKKGYGCRHNLKYWRCEEYFGVGPSAHSLLDGKRFAVCSDTEKFINNHFQQTYVTDEESCTVEEKLMLALRLSEGADISEYDIGADKKEKLLSTAKTLEKHGLLKILGNRITLTVKGFLLSNRIICLLQDSIELGFS